MLPPGARASSLRATAVGRVRIRRSCSAAGPMRATHAALAASFELRNPLQLHAAKLCKTREDDGGGRRGEEREDEQLSLEQDFTWLSSVLLLGFGPEGCPDSPWALGGL